MQNPLQVEVESRTARGAELLSVEAFAARFAALGYRLDRSLDCRSTAQWLESGRTYPACSVYLVEADTGMSAFHYQARRDSRFDAMQALRDQVFAVSRGAILEA